MKWSELFFKLPLMSAQQETLLLYIVYACKNLRGTKSNIAIFRK